MDINYDEEEDDVEAYTHEWEEMENDQSFMELLDQSEWFVHSLVEYEVNDKVKQPGM